MRHVLHSIRLTWFLMFVAGFALHGCGGPAETPKAKVSGTVTLDDKPLADGEITFETRAAGVREVLPIKDGKFEGEVQIGERRVEIGAYREAKAATDMYGSDAPITKENYIPARYNTETKEKATVTAAGPNSFDFKVTSK